MKTIQEVEEERMEHQKMDANELMERMFSFIPISKKHATSAIISAKYCAKVACDYLIETLPNINETPPDSRNDERTYKQYWRGVKIELAQFKFSTKKENDYSKN
jgi:hypothetical protein